MDSPPAIAPPTIVEGMTRIGSRAAKGIAPSEIKHHMFYRMRDRQDKEATVWRHQCTTEIHG
ncbi:hypothetical protein A9Y87_15780 [Salmonella enterica subsp. enterica]|nr:hypothetical protein A9Y87_15780 [Salmonella enterica subsp. enterica]